MATEIAAGAVQPAGEHVVTASSYITHHLGHLRSAPQTSIIDFSVINYDTIFWSVSMGAIACLLMWMAARRATVGVPGRFQAMVEMVVELVEDQSKAIVHGNRSFIAPLALTVFLWVAMMNAIDLLPVDWVPWVAENLFHQRFPGHDPALRGRTARQNQTPVRRPGEP